MATNFPSGLDSFTNPSASDKMDSVSVPHATQHANLNDAVEALEAKVGADGSAVTSSHDYILSNGVLPTLNVDSGVLVVDETNNRVGVNDSSPSYALDVTGDINTTGDLRIGGTAVGKWVDYSGSQTFNANLTVGNGTLLSRYARIGDVVHMSGYFQLGSTSAISGYVDMSLPYTNLMTTVQDWPGHLRFWDQSANSFYGGSPVSIGTGSMRLTYFLLSGSFIRNGDLNANTPFTWTTGDVLFWSFSYGAVA